MVTWSETAENDLDDIFTALLSVNPKTEEPYLSEEEAEEYCEKLFLACNNIDALICVTHARYEMHKEYGEYIYEYNPNRRTTWYIIYDIESNDIDVIIRKIISNHTTFVFHKFPDPYSLLKRVGIFSLALLVLTCRIVSLYGHSHVCNFVSRKNRIYGRKKYTYTSRIALLLLQ